MTRRWLDPPPITVPASLREAVGGHALVAELLARRGILTEAQVQSFLDPEFYQPTPPEALPGMERAVARLERALGKGERICVWGDFDVDGQTATTVLVSTLRDLAARAGAGADVLYHIPVRETESHGIKLPWLQKELERGVQVLVTCDTGIDAHEAVAFAQARGVDVIITDHHELPPELPQAYAVINPHLLPAGHPLGALPGVGVAYKLAEALYRSAGEPEAAAELLDLVALGIVADVAQQSGDTRYLLQRGLRALRATRRLGLQELMKAAGVVAAQVSEETIGFALAPRLNALGRLDDASVIVEFFTTEDLSQARILASQLEALNNRRRLLTDQVEQAAEAQLASDPTLLDHAALVLAHPAWPGGVIGLVANRLAERYQRPVVLLTVPPGELARGSARSVENCHITEALASQASLLASFGGHAQAAGLSLPAERIPELRRGLSRAVALQLAEGEVQSTLQIDGYVDWNDLSEAFVTELERLAPFGPGNPQPILATCDLRIAAQRTLGREERHLRLSLEDAEGRERTAVWWRWDGTPLPEGDFDLAYTVRVNDYRGQREVQVVWQAARVRTPPPLTLIETAALEVLDYRDAVDPQQIVRELMRQGDVLVWYEGREGDAVEGVTRQAVAPTSTLVIWTSPPGMDVLRDVLARVRPSRVAVVGREPELAEAGSFLRYLGGLVKYALSARAGVVDVSVLAAETAQREATVRKGLAWMVARGFISALRAEGDRLYLGAPLGPDAAMSAAFEADVRSLLAETAAYRRHFRRADMQRLLQELVNDGEPVR